MLTFCNVLHWKAQVKTELHHRQVSQQFTNFRPIQESTLLSNGKHNLHGALPKHCFRLTQSYIQYLKRPCQKEHLKTFQHVVSITIINIFVLSITVKFSIGESRGERRYSFHFRRCLSHLHSEVGNILMVLSHLLKGKSQSFFYALAEVTEPNVNTSRYKLKDQKQKIKCLCYQI